MSHRLPPVNSPLRECFEISDLVEFHTRKRPFVTIQQARASARETFATARKGSLLKIFYIVLLANDDLALVSFGPRGGMKRLWNFGKA